MSKITSGVFPVHTNQFSIGTKGAASEEADILPIAEMSTFSLSIDGTVEEWTPFETEGWIKRLLTGKSLTISLSGKRCIGDAGNDYVSDSMMGMGQECSTVFKWVLPNGATLKFECVLNVKNNGGGDSTNVGPLEFDVMSSGKPVFTPAS